MRLSGDGQAVICHDATFDAGKFPVAKRKSSLFLFCVKFCKRYQTTAFLDIELKVAGLETITLDLLRAYPPERGYVISSFLPEVLQSVDGKDHVIPLGLICETPAQLQHWPRLPVQYVIPHHSLARKKVISEMQERGKKVFVWTVNSSADMKRFIAWGVDGIISDHPERLAQRARNPEDPTRENKIANISPRAKSDLTQPSVHPSERLSKYRCGGHYEAFSIPSRIACGRGPNRGDRVRAESSAQPDSRFWRQQST